MNSIPKWGPRLARLYSEDVRKLEALHANRLSPGTKTWSEAVEALFQRMTNLGPAKGAKLVSKAIDYLNNISRDERAHLMIASWAKSRTAWLMFATFSYGNHPDARVREEGLTILIHIIHCSRSNPLRATRIPVAYISKHAMSRLYERGHDITETSHATSAFAFIGVLGYLTHRSPKHVDGGMAMRFSDTLAVGALHRFMKPDPVPHEETVLDIRTVLPVDEVGPARQHQLEQGEAAAAAVIEWFEDADDLDEGALAEKIPALPRREDHYSARAATVFE